MFHKHIFRTLSLTLLAMLFAGQASAAPINHSVNWGRKNAVPLTSTSSTPISVGALLFAFVALSPSTYSG